MSSLKERFDEFKPQPDNRVWQQIEQRINMSVRRRRMTVTASAVAAAAAVAVAMALLRPSAGDESRFMARQHVSSTEMSEVNSVSRENVGVVSAQPVKEEELAVVMETSLSEEIGMNTTTSPSMPVMAVATPTAAVAESAPIATMMPLNTAKPMTVTSSTPIKPMASTTQGMISSAPIIGVEIPDTVVSEPKTKHLIGLGPDSADVEPVIWIPNAFAPDDPDPKVSQFKVIPANTASVRSYEIYIYSRQGRKVFHSRDINEAWDGVSNGHAQPMGTYVYVIQAFIENEGLKKYKGTITLIR